MKLAVSAQRISDVCPSELATRGNKCAYEATEMLLVRFPVKGCPSLSVRVQPRMSVPSEASLVRICRLTKAKRREEEGHFGEDDSDDGFLTQAEVDQNHRPL